MVDKTELNSVKFIKLRPLYSICFNHYRDFEYFLYFKICWKIKFFTFITLFTFIASISSISAFSHIRNHFLKLSIKMWIFFFSLKNSWHTHSDSRLHFQTTLLQVWISFFIFVLSLLWKILFGFFILVKLLCINL